MTRQIILDTETTGLDFKSGHRIIEIGCVEILNRRFTGEEFQTYLNPDREIDEEAEKIHGLSAGFLKDKPRFNEIFESFYAFIKDSELIIHNAGFDLGFLNNEIKLLNKKHPLINDMADKITDTLQLAREKHPGQRNNLDALVQRYEISGYDRNYHGALLDSKILGSVYLAMTGGQGDLIFENENQPNYFEEEKVTIKIKKDKNSGLVVNEVLCEEEEIHLNYLKKMEKDTGTRPLWIQKDKTYGDNK